MRGADEVVPTHTVDPTHSVDPADTPDAPEGVTGDPARDGGPEAPGARTWRHPSPGRWVLFAMIALAVVILDQLSKAWVVARLAQGDGFQVLGDWIRIVHWRNTGILFGMLPQSATAFAVVSLVVVALIVAYHARAGRGLLVTIALALLLGGALGNLIDRLHYGSVVDFVDMGIGSWRFYTYNVADAAISTSLVLLIAMALIPRLADFAPDG